MVFTKIKTIVIILFFSWVYIIVRLIIMFLDCFPIYIKNCVLATNKNDDMTVLVFC